MKKLLLLGFALIISNSDARLPAGELQTLSGRIFATAAAAPASFAFVVKSYGGKCLDFGPSPQVIGSPVFISACNGRSAQQVVVREINQRHEVILVAGNEVIGVKANQATTLAGRRALVLAAKSEAENPLELQNLASRLTGASANQIFALDGDSIILATNRNLVVKVQNNRGADRTPLVLGRRDLVDSEFWTFTASDGSARRPTSGFVRVPQPRDHRSTTEQFLSALISAQPGTVIEVAESSDEINLRDHTFLSIPAEVTIRGDRHGVSPGAEISAPFNSGRENFIIPIFVIKGNDVRITGLRLHGPSRDRNHDLRTYVGISTDSSFNSIIDHNDMSDWTNSAVLVDGGNKTCVCSSLAPSTLPEKVRVVRNFLHHNERWSSGYGVEIAHNGYASIVGNTFVSNRHAVADDGTALSGYRAYFNLILKDVPTYSGDETGDEGRGPQQDFDMHGRDRSTCSPQEGGLGGSFLEIVGNTSLARGDFNRHILELRGTPCYSAEFHNNVTLESLGDAILNKGDSSKLSVTDDNQFNAPNPTTRLGVGDFDGDGLDDLFLATGKAWYYSPAGIGEWRLINTQKDMVGSLLFGDFDGDGRTDVFTQHGFDWVVSWGGASKYEKINVSGQSPNDFAIGFFDDDKRADVFYADGHEWSISFGGVGMFKHLAFDTHRVSDLRFGDFNADGRTDIFAVVGDDWRIFDGAMHTWSRLRSKLNDSVAGLMVADFNGDGRADVARLSRLLFEDFHNLEVSDGGLGVFKVRGKTGVSVAVGNFDDTPGADVLMWHDNFLDITSGSGAPRKQSRQDMR